MFLVSGCSFTSDKQYVDGSGKNWVKQLSEKLNEDYENVALGGYCNNNIFNSVYDKIVLSKNNYSKVIVMWTGFERLKIFQQSVDPIAWERNYKLFGHPHNPNNTVNPPTGLKTNKLKHAITYYNFEKVIDDNLRYQYILQQECFLRGIDLYYCQGVKEISNLSQISHLFDSDTILKHDNFYKHIKESKFYKLIDRNNTLEKNYRMRYGNTPKLIIPKDNHPSEYGHSLIANDLFNIIRK